MKNKQLLTLTLAGLMVASQTSPILATTVPETTENVPVVTTEPQKETGEIKLVVKDTKGNSVKDLEFKILDSAGNQLQFINTNNNYEFESSGFYKTVKTDENGVVNISNLADGSYSVIYTGSNYKYITTADSTVYVSGNSLTTNIQVRENNGSLVFTFAGEDGTAVKNAKFVIKNSEGKNLSFSSSNGVYTYAENGSEAIETNVAGKITIEGLPVGTYTLVQTESPIEYNGPMITKDFSITLESETKISATSLKQYGSASLVVIDSINSDSLSGSEFEVKDTNGTSLNFEYFNGEYTFTRNGGSTIIKTSNNGSALLKDLPTGTYTLVETKTPNNYDKSADKSFTIEKNITTKVSVTNVKSMGNIEITVTDDKTSEGVQDYTFKITDNEDNEVKFTKESDGVYTVGGNETVVTTDVNGKILIKNLLKGSYKIKQDAASNGYLKDNTVFTAEVTSQITSPVSVIASKTNVAINIMNADNEGIANIPVKIIDSSNKIVLEASTNETGKVLIPGLSKGSYSYMLGEVPSPYMNKEYKGAFTINEKGEVENLQEVLVEFNKIEISANIEGCKFQLVNKADANEKYLAETDVSGKAIFDKLPDGTYVLTQTEAPEGLKVSDKETEIVIDRTTKESFNFDVKNDDIEETIPGIADKENTESHKSRNIIILVVSMIAMIVGAVAYALVKTKNEETKANKNTKPESEKPETLKFTEEIVEGEQEEVDEKVNTVAERPDVDDVTEDPYEQEEKNNEVYKDVEDRKPQVEDLENNPYDESDTINTDKKLEETTENIEESITLEEAMVEEAAEEIVENSYNAEEKTETSETVDKRITKETKDS